MKDKKLSSVNKKRSVKVSKGYTRNMSKVSSSKRVTVSREAVSGRFVVNPSDAELVTFLNKSGLSELSKVLKRASANNH